MHFSGSPRPAGSSASPFGIILVPGSASAAVLPSRSCQISSAAADSPPDVAAARGFAPITTVGWKCLKHKGFRPIFAGVDLNSSRLFPTISAGGLGDEHRQDAIRAAAGLSALEH